MGVPIGEICYWDPIHADKSNGTQITEYILFFFFFFFNTSILGLILHFNKSFFNIEVKYLPVHFLREIS